jgi:hypothetical protein
MPENGINPSVFTGHSFHQINYCTKRDTFFRGNCRKAAIKVRSLPKTQAFYRETVFEREYPHQSAGVRIKTMED